MYGDLSPQYSNMLNGMLNTVNTGVQQVVPTVPGEDGAKSYPLGRNSSVILADSTRDNTLWLKVTDSYGTPTYKHGVVTWTESKEKTEETNSENYVSMEQFKELEKKVNDLLEELK